MFDLFASLALQLFAMCQVCINLLISSGSVILSLVAGHPPLLSLSCLQHVLCADYTDPAPPAFILSGYLVSSPSNFPCHT